MERRRLAFRTLAILAAGAFAEPALAQRTGENAVTSADDHRVYIVDAASRSVIDVFTAGPALREVAATGPRQFSVSDVCSITTFRW